LSTSIIDSVTIHELIHSVLDTRAGADVLTDFLVNDDLDSAAIPDTLYFSNGTKAPVSAASNAAADHTISLADRTVQVTATLTEGWTFIRIADPGAGYKLASVVRSDGTVLLTGTNAWQTTKEYDKATSRFVSVPRLNLLDYNSTGSYTVTYVLDDNIAPQVNSIDAVSPDPRNAPVDSVNVQLSETIDLATFDWHDIALTRNGAAVGLSPGVSVALVGGTTSTYAISGLTAFTAADGAYQLTVDGSGLEDYGANAGLGVKSVSWSNGDAPAYVKLFGPIAPEHGSTPVDAIDLTFSKAIDAASFDRADLTLTRDGAVVAMPGSVTIANLGGGSYCISGLTFGDATEGTYVLNINATDVADGLGAPGLGSASVTWVVDTTPPVVTAVQTLANNPRNISVQTLDVTFSEPIDLTTFDRSDIVLTSNGSAVAMDDRVTVEAVSGSVYRIKGINWFAGQEGSYVLTVAGTGVTDLAGNVGVAPASTNWVMDTTRPVAPAGLAITPDRGISSTDGLTNIGAINLSGALAESAISVRLFDVTAGTDLGYANVTGSAFSAAINLGAGVHQIRAVAIDPAGNFSADAFFTVLVDLASPTLTSLANVDTPRTTPLSTEDVTLSEQIDLATFDWHDLSLTVNGGPNLITAGAGISVAFVAGSTYRISGLEGLTQTNGIYQLMVDSAGIQDLAGNAGLGVKSVSWDSSFDNTAPPTSTATSPALVHALAFTVSWSGVPAPGMTIGAYDVYSQVDGGTFTLWLSHVTITSEIFTGSAQHQYGFFSIATDLAGHREALKTEADATTFVSILGEIDGRVFEDVNGTGTDTASPPNGLAGWTVFLDTNGNGTLDPRETSTTSGADGAYAFTGLQPGVYLVTEIVQAGWEMTYPSAGDSAIHTATVTVKADSKVYLNDFEMAAGTGGSVLSTASTALNQALIGLDQFRSDVRFAGIDGAGYTVVVLDTGVDVNSPFFGSIGSNGLASGIAYQYNFVADTSSASDVLGHGTAVASVIASRDAANPGIAPGVRIIDLKVLDDAGKGTFGTVGRALQWVIDNAGAYNIVSVNMSFSDGGDYTYSQSLYSLGSQLDALANSNVIVVSAAGNGYYDSGSVPGVSYPAADPGVIAVGAVWGSDLGGPYHWSNGAVDNSTGPNRIISFSQRDANIGEIFAPGGLIESAKPGGGVATYSGTSLASPVIAATAALAQELAVETIGRRLTLDEFRYFLESTATIIHDGDDEDDNVVNTGLDYRRVDVMALAEAILAYDGSGIPEMGGSGATSGSTGGLVPISAAGAATITVGPGDVIQDIDFGNRHLPPVATVVLDASSPRTNDVLTATVSTSDPGGDPVSVSYIWKRNGTVIAGASGSTLDLSVAGQGNKGDVITVEVTPWDGHRLGETATAQATVADSPPAATVQLGTNSPETNDILTVSATSSDPDGDLVTLHYVWKRNGATIPGESSETLDLSLATHGDLGDVITVEVTPNDGEIEGATASAQATVVDVTPPSAPTALAILPDRGASSSDGVTNTSAISLVGLVGEPGVTVFLFDVTTNTDLGSVQPIGTGTAIAFAKELTLAAGTHHLRARGVDASGNVSADAYLDVVVDQTRPTSAVNALPAIATSYNLTIGVTGSDPGTTNSGVAKYDLYVAVDGGQFSSSPWATVTPAAPSAVYHAAPGHHYYFRSIATDVADNVETKAVTSEAGTTVPDLAAPVTAAATATPNDTLAQFTVYVSGIDADGSGLATFQVYVQVDAGPVTRFATVPAGIPNGTSGQYAATVKYQANDDGVSHTYRFFTRGTDRAGNVEPDHASPADIIVTHEFQPKPLQITQLLVQNGSVGRSFIQNVDLLFNKTDGDGDTPISDLITESRVAIIRHPLTGAFSPADPTVSLNGVLSAVDHALHFNFGQYGLGGLARANMSLNNYWNALAAGDGYYEVDVDLNGDGAIRPNEQVFFYRLLGDVNGDKTVDATDSNLITTNLGAIGINPFDANGDGTVDATDRSLALLSKGRSLKSTLRLDG
jgi:subtilisin family serine protease